MKILYVEDNPVDADLTRRHFRRVCPQHELEVVDSARAARERLAVASPDALLLDMQLMDGHGLELLAEVRAANDTLPIVMLTGSGDEETVVSALRAGCDDYVVKAGDYLSTLQAVVAQACVRRAVRGAQRAEPVRVLYAERHPSDVDLFTRHVARHAPHLQVRAVVDGPRAIEAVKQSPHEIDVVLLDYQLAGLNALEVVKALRDELGYDRPVIVVTGQGDEDKAVQTLKLGATDFLVKRDDLMRRLPMAIESAHYRHRLEQESRALKENQALFQQMASVIDDVFWLSDPHARRVLYVSPAVEKVWGLEVEGPGADPLRWLARVAAQDRRRAMRAVVHPGSDTVEIELKVATGRGERRDVLLRSYPVLDARGRVVRRAGIAQDITRRKEQEATISFQAHHDALTGLPNRTLLLDRLSRALGQARRQDSGIAVLFLDLDRFKNVNDSLGHLYGDELLQQVAVRLTQALRANDTICRLGGDEFVVVLDTVEDLSEPAHVADKIMDALAQPFAVRGLELHMSASVGISMYPRDGDDPEALLKYADIAMYKAKQAGRNGYRFFSAAMDAEAHQRLRLENELRRAVKRQELRLHFQPVMLLAEQRVLCVEALVRWQHPVDGLLMPDAFIPLAEESDLILDVGRWVIDEACRQHRLWREQGLPRLRIAINLSARQLTRPGLVESLQLAMLQHQVDGEDLEFEVTETAVMDRGDETSQTLQQLRQLGVRLAVDDFGTGYSSLAYLPRLPIQRLKIDRSFVRGLSADAQDAAIVEAVIAMAHKLRLEVVAEGVEEEAQRRFLQSHGCDEIQGYLLAPPLPPEQLVDWIVRHDGALQGQEA